MLSSARFGTSGWRTACLDQRDGFLRKLNCALPKVLMMEVSRSVFLHLATSAVMLPTVAAGASTSYPTRPVHLLVGYAAGGPLDISARLIGQWLSEHLGQPFIIENRPGGGSNLATETVVRAPPDGYTLLEISASNAWNAALYDNLSFNFIHDIVPIAGVRRSSGVLEVNPTFPARTVPEFIAYAKAGQGQCGLGRRGKRASPFRRVVQGHDGSRPCHSELSRLGTRAARSHWWASPSHVRRCEFLDWAHQGG